MPGTDAHADVASLIKQLEEAGDRDTAQQLIADLVAAGEDAAGPLVEALGRPDLKWWAPLWIDQALFRLGVEALPALVRALEEGDVPLRRRAVSLLFRIKAPQVIQPIARFLCHPDRETRHF